MLAFAAAALLTVPPAGAGGRTLLTPHYTITITERCGEYDVGCGNVLYHSVSRSGKTITLHGTHVMAMCKDGVTPCHSLGYRFMNRGVAYDVSDEGELTVTRGKATLLDEQGKWNDN